jgi:heme exporter protein B
MNELSLTTAFYNMVRRDLTLALRRRSEIANPLLFFVIVVSLFPMALGPESSTLKPISSGIIWVGALLASLLSLDSLFRSDFDDGSLEQIALSPHPLAALVLAKVAAHWLVTGIPILLMSPLLGVLLHMSTDVMWPLVLTLLLGTPVLSLIGSIGVALTVGLRRGGMLLALLILPLYIPVLIFAATAVHDASVGMAITAHLAYLGAILALAVTLAPMAAAAALRISLG